MGNIFIIAIVIFFSSMLIPTIFGLIKKHQIKKESKLNKNDFIMCHSIGWVIFMIIVSCLITTILILMNFFGGYSTQLLIADIIVIPFLILFMLSAIGMAREKLVVKDDNILITPVFGKKIKCLFSEISKIKEREWISATKRLCIYEIYTNKKIYSISDDIVGFNIFMQIIREKGIHIETIDEQIKDHKKNKKDHKNKDNY